MNQSLLGEPPRRPGPIVVVGGGISGLATAYYLRSGSAEVELLEGGDRFGGNIRTERVDDFLFDVGPDSFLRTRPEALQLCRELGLEDEMIVPGPAGRGVYIARDGRLERMPEGLALGVPLNLGSLLDCSSLSPVGKARALFEPLVRSRKNGSEESIGGFMRRRLGAEVANRLANPLLAGVFAGDPERLSMDAAFPQLVELERRHGSLVRGMLKGSGWKRLFVPAPPSSPFTTPRQGLGRLIERLVESLPASILHTGVEIQGLDYDGEEYVLTTSEGKRRATSVVLALPPWHAASLLSGGQASEAERSRWRALQQELGAVNGSATATAFYAFRGAEVERALDASGFIVPEGEGQILAATWISSKWEGRAPAGSVLLRAFIGGARAPEALERTDSELAELGLAELRRFMGRLDRPLWQRVYRYRRGSPQPELGHLARLARVRQLLSGLPGLFLIGAGYGGVGIPDCVRQARGVARVLLEGAPAS